LLQIFSTVTCVKHLQFFSHRGAAEAEEVGGTERGLVGEETLLPTSGATVLNTGLLHYFCVLEHNQPSNSTQHRSSPLILCTGTVLRKTLLSATGYWLAMYGRNKDYR
jgi:hypothetical protein